MHDPDEYAVLDPETVRKAVFDLGNGGDLMERIRE